MSDVNEQIESIIQEHKVVLFMKGTRVFPQCGFSQRSVELFKRCGVKVHGVNVLADPAIRQGIKDYSNWPTIPQAYIDGKFVGGSDILLEMYENGELQSLLGVEQPDENVAAPTLTVSEAAQEAFSAAVEDMGDDVLRFDVSPTFAYDLYFAPAKDDDFVVACGTLKVHVARSCAARANGTKIDYIDGPDGAGFKIDNPNEPPSVKNISPAAVKAALDAGECQLFDCRSERERAMAQIDGAKPLEGDGQQALAALPKDAMIVVLCHHGVRSRPACQQILEAGYTNVHNLTGGIDAWSATVDSSIPRY
jgi:monothiol glutaredoxin